MADRPVTFEQYRPARRFVLNRKHDVTGVSGTGIVAEGVLFSDDVACVQWLGDFPTSVVWHERGMDSIVAVHGHGGHTEIVFLDDEDGHPVSPSSARKMMTSATEMMTSVLKGATAVDAQSEGGA